MRPGGSFDTRRRRGGPPDDNEAADMEDPRTIAELRAALRFRIYRQWTRFHIAPNIERWGHPGGLFGLVEDGRIPLDTVPLPETLPPDDTPDPWYQQELALLRAHPEIGTRVDPDAPHPGPGWARARWWRGFVDPDIPPPLPDPDAGQRPAYPPGWSPR
ncbi:hypothetical protein [Maricaulis sp.]|uniref:hypothetical protein n=1 Tax=Maricaulis sp. TaxID=1486257 RepID=UPI002634DC9B|nr:hypothetical protein [Maricaulis sp.]